MRLPERSCADCEFPGRYILDEARFRGGQDKLSHSSPQEAKQ